MRSGRVFLPLIPSTANDYLGGTVAAYLTLHGHIPRFSVISPHHEAKSPSHERLLSEARRFFESHHSAHEQETAPYRFLFLSGYTPIPREEILLTYFSNAETLQKLPGTVAAELLRRMLSSSNTSISQKLKAQADKLLRDPAIYFDSNILGLVTKTFSDLRTDDHFLDVITNSLTPYPIRVQLSLQFMCIAPQYFDDHMNIKLPSGETISLVKGRNELDIDPTAFDSTIVRPAAQFGYYEYLVANPGLEAAVEFSDQIAKMAPLSDELVTPALLLDASMRIAKDQDVLSSNKRFFAFADSTSWDMVSVNLVRELLEKKPLATIHPYVLHLVKQGTIQFENEHVLMDALRAIALHKESTANNGEDIGDKRFPIIEFFTSEGTLGRYEWTLCENNKQRDPMKTTIHQAARSALLSEIMSCRNNSHAERVLSSGLINSILKIDQALLINRTPLIDIIRDAFIQYQPLKDGDSEKAQKTILSAFCLARSPFQGGEIVSNSENATRALQLLSHAMTIHPETVSKFIKGVFSTKTRIKAYFNLPSKKSSDAVFVDVLSCPGIHEAFQNAILKAFGPEVGLKHPDQEIRRKAIRSVSNRMAF